mgnify:CR=1 FL=1
MGSEGYFLNQFLVTHTNRRTDRWGGSPEKRMQFLRDVAQCVRENVGPDYPVLTGDYTAQQAVWASRPIVRPCSIGTTFPWGE